MNKLIDHDAILRHRNRGLNPTNPHLTGSAQGPEVLFQNMETVNKFYDKTPEHVETAMEEFFTSTGRRYKLYDYYGHPEASDVIVIMGAGVPVVKEVVDYLMQLGDDKTSKIGLVNVHLFRPWKLDRFIEAFPGSVQRVAVLDRCKESGSLGEPLFLDVAASFQCVQRQLYVIGGRYGLGSKDFTPAMALAVYQNLQSDKRQHPFTVGIEDDVTNLSLNFKVNRNINTVPKGTTECLFWGKIEGSRLFLSLV